MFDLGDKVYLPVPFSFEETNYRVFNQVVRDLVLPVGDRMFMDATGASILRREQSIKRYLW